MERIGRSSGMELGTYCCASLGSESQATGGKDSVELLRNGGSLLRESGDESPHSKELLGELGVYISEDPVKLLTQLSGHLRTVTRQITLLAKVVCQVEKLHAVVFVVVE